MGALPNRAELERRFGPFNKALSTTSQWRFGKKGSVAVELDGEKRGLWHDFESGEGGTVLEHERPGLNGYANGHVNGHGGWTTIHYVYRGVDGVPIHRVTRRQRGTERRFFQERYDPATGRYVPGMDGVDRLPYRLPDLLDSSEIWVVEGEKDADRLAGLGLAATTNPGGAGKWRDAFARWFAGKGVVIVPDNDKAGRKHAHDVARSLAGKAARVRILELPGLPHKGDVSAWLEAGGTPDELERLAEAAPDWRQIEAAEAPAETEAPQLKRVALDDIMTAAADHPRFVVAPIIPRRLVTLLGGHGGMGKSVLGLALAAHAASGRHWARFDVEQCRAVFVSLEDDASLIRMRLRRIIETYGLPGGEVIENLTVFDASDIDAALVTEVNDFGVRTLRPTPLMMEVEQAARGAGLLVIDNASDAYDGDENSRREVRSFLRHLTRIARKNDAAVILLAHIDKRAARAGSDGNSYSGSTAWHNSTRSRLALVEDDGLISLAHEKNNLGPKAEAVALKFTDQGVLVPTVVDPRALAEAKEAGIRADAETVLDLLRSAGAARLTVPTATTGQCTTQHVLEAMAECPPSFKGRDGRKRLTAAITYLERNGRIVRTEYVNGYRNKRERWEPAVAGTNANAVGGHV